MNIRFDHIVFYVDNLHQAVRDMKNKGFHVVYGGSHPMWGTYNALIYFSTYYIELIAIEHEEIFKKAALKPFTLHETIENNNRDSGIARFAFRTSKTSVVTNLLLKNHFIVEGPEIFSRNTPADTTISWTLIHTGKNDCITLPFIIDWQIDDQVRFKELIKNGTISTHQNGVTAIQSIVMPLQHFEEYISYFKALNIPHSIYEHSITVDMDGITLIYDEKCTRQEILFVGGNRNTSFIYGDTLFKEV